MRFLDVYKQYEKNKLSCEEAADILGISISTFYRKRQIYEEGGVAVNSLSI
jgi:transposase